MATVAELFDRVAPVTAQGTVPHVVVAGPGSERTIPGVMGAEVVHAAANFGVVSRLEIDPTQHVRSGLHRAPSLAALYSYAGEAVPTWHVAGSTRAQRKAFQQHLRADTAIAIALSWPSIANEWIGDFVAAAKDVGAVSVVLRMSGPSSDVAQIDALARRVVRADLVLVGDHLEANRLSGILRSDTPVIDTHRALSLLGRQATNGTHRVTAFLPKDDLEGLTVLLRAFDAIPEAWSNSYHLTIVMRSSSNAVTEAVAHAFYASRIDLVSEDLTEEALIALCDDSSAVVMADPGVDSRAYAMAEQRGVATVLLLDTSFPVVGKGYVGGLVADVQSPASIYVALMHAIRLAELNFPTPKAWSELGLRLRRELARSRTTGDGASTSFST